MKLAFLLIGVFLLGAATEALWLDSDCRAGSTHIIRLGGTPYYCLDGKTMEGLLYDMYTSGLGDAAANSVKGGT